MINYILSIESTCDETSVAILSYEPSTFLTNYKYNIKSHLVASQIPIHQLTGGVVPEVAAREQQTAILPLIDHALFLAFNPKSQYQFGLGQKYLKKLNSITVSAGPGLLGSLIVGVEVANTLALSLNIPIIPINHYEGHLLSWLKPNSKPHFPCLTLTASGGHTSLYLVKKPGSYKLISNTLDDAAGEAFDKGARQLGLTYPGGPSIEKAAATGNPKTFNLPRPLTNSSSLNFSFSGLKTALSLLIKSLPKPTPTQTSNLAASFQAAITDTLIIQLSKAIKIHKPKSLAIVGGVALNKSLHSKAKQLAQRNTLPIYFPLANLYTDNAAMIGIASLFHSSQPNKFAIPNPNLSLNKI